MLYQFNFSLLKKLYSQAEIDLVSFKNVQLHTKFLDDYFETRVLAKSHEDAEQVSDAVFDELSDKFFCLKESFEA